MNHIGDEPETPDLLTMSLQILSEMAPATGIAEWSHEMGVKNKTIRPFHTHMIWGHDLVLDWGLIALRIKECSNTPGRAPTPTEIKAYVVRSVELTHKELAEAIEAYRPPQQQMAI
jgi:hypothetical protein